MSARTDAQLKTDNTTYITDAAGSTSAPDIRTVVENIIDSKLNIDKFDANTILKADSDNTPIALTVGASTIVGRTAAGAIAALTDDQVKFILFGDPATSEGMVISDGTTWDRLAVAASKIILRKAAGHIVTEDLTYFVGTTFDNLVTDAFKIAFRATDNYIKSSASGILDIVAKTTLLLSYVNKVANSLYSDEGLVSLDDGNSKSIDVNSKSGWGFALIGDSQESAPFTFDGSGNVTLLSDATAHVANSDTASSFCIYGDGAGNILFKNNLAATLDLKYKIFWG